VQPNLNILLCKVADLLQGFVQPNLNKKDCKL